MYQDNTGGNVATSSGTLRLVGTALNLAGMTTASAATAGGASPLPANPQGYMIFQIGGVDHKFPFYLV
jgi:hypothetical protein